MEAPSDSRPTVEELADAFRLTGYFLARHVFEPRGLAPSDARASFVALVARTVAAE